MPHFRLALSKMRQASTVPWLVIAAVTTVMAVRRAAGFTHHDLFFDDAWAALAARTNFGNALHMTVSTPGWTMLTRQWILLNPHSTPWTQVPTYVVSLVAGFLFYALLTRLRCSRWLAVATTCALIVSPVMTTYSTRVKPYTVELLLGLVVVWVGDRVRREPSPRAYTWLGVASALAVVISLAVATVVVGVWIALGWNFWRNRAERRRWFVAAAISGLVTGVTSAPFLLHRPKVLGDNWIHRGYMGNYQSLRGFLHNCIKTMAGIPQNLFGVPLGHGFTDVNKLQVHSKLVATLALIVLGACVWAVLRARDDAFATAARAAVVVIFVSFAGALADVVPLGDGRTDLVLYPSFLIVLAAGGRLLFLRLWGGRPVALRAGVIALVCAGLLYSGASLPARYPEINLRGLYAKLAPQLRPGDVIVVPAFLSFPWAYENVTPWRLQLHGSQWPQGFQVVSTDPKVLLPHEWRIGDPQLAGLAKRFTRVWYVGYTLGAWYPYVNHKGFGSSIPMGTFTKGGLTAAGWKTSWFPVYGLNCYAEPLTLQGIRKG